MDVNQPVFGYDSSDLISPRGGGEFRGHGIDAMPQLHFG